MTKYQLSPLRNTKKNKARIIRNIKMRIEQPVVRKKTNWMPIIVSLNLFIMMIITGLPMLKQAFLNGDVSIEAVEIPDVEYSVLVASNYIEETNEIIYQQRQQVISYKVDTQITETLVSVEDANIVDAAVNDKWVVWTQLGDQPGVIYAKNRQTNEVKKLDVQYFHEINLDGDNIIMIASKLREQDYYDDGYVRYSLLNDDFEPIHIFADGLVGQGVYSNNRLVVTEETKDGTLFQVYNTDTLENTANKFLPIKDFHRMQLYDAELFMMLEEKTGTKLAVFNIETMTFYELGVDEVFSNYSTDGTTFALSVEDGDSDDVQLYKRIGKTLEIYSTLPTIKERIVRPKIDGKTFVVNGDHTMQTIYLLTIE